MALPFLPGNTFRDPTRTNYAKSQTLVVNKGYQMPANLTATPGTRGLTDEEYAAYAGTDPELTYGRRPTKEIPQFVPAFVAFDKLVLRFAGYFKETVVESPDEEPYRVRRVQVQFFLEDDSIAVIEPRQQNSGLPQGTLIKRQLIPREDGSLYNMYDLNVGAEVTFYGKTIRLTACDAFTRSYLAEHGVEVSADEPQPRDPHEDLLATRRPRTRTHTVNLEQDKLLRFLRDDGNVLRFFCVWDDRDRISRQLRPFVLHFFLADDTVEVREVHSTNDGRDPFPLLLNRNKLPKKNTGLTQIGEEVADYYTAADFDTGKTINVFGRPFLVYDCDGYTRSWYQQRMQRAMEPITLTTPAPPAVKPAPPPYNGFGTEEDSLGSVNCLEPKPPKRDLVKMAKYEGKMLRFEARMVTDDPINKTRMFVVSFFLADDTVSVTEPPQRNSGIEGGKFLDRCPCFYPGTKKKLQAKEFFIGATVNLYSHHFLLIDAAEFALKFMEENPQQFPRSDSHAIHQRIRATLAGSADPLNLAFADADVAPDGFCSPNVFQNAVLAIGVPDLLGQEVITLLRYYDTNRNGRINARAFYTAVAPAPAPHAAATTTTTTATPTDAPVAPVSYRPNAGAISAVAV